MIEDIECELVSVDNDTLWFLPPHNVTPSINYTLSDSWLCPPQYEYHIVVSSSTRHIITQVLMLCLHQLMKKSLF